MAFVNEVGRPLYLVSKKGNTTDGVGRAFKRRMGKLGMSRKFMNLRKSTNTAVKNLMNRDFSPTDETLRAVGEIIGVPD